MCEGTYSLSSNVMAESANVTFCQIGSWLPLQLNEKKNSTIYTLSKLFWKFHNIANIDWEDMFKNWPKFIFHAELSSDQNFPTNLKIFGRTSENQNWRSCDVNKTIHHFWLECYFNLNKQPGYERCFFVLFSRSLCRETISGLTLCQ